MADKLAPSNLSDLSEDYKTSLEIAMENAKRGPMVLRRSGNRSRQIPWTPPVEIAVSHEDFGELKVNIETGEIAVAQAPIDAQAEAKP